MGTQCSSEHQHPLRAWVTPHWGLGFSGEADVPKQPGQAGLVGKLLACPEGKQSCFWAMTGALVFTC